MSTFAFLLLCAQACLIQNVFGSSHCGKGINMFAYKQKAGCIDGFSSGYDLGKAFYAAGAAMDSGIRNAAAYGSLGEGELAVSGAVPVSGNTRVTGQVPAIGTVQFSGTVPAAGQVSLRGQCDCDTHKYNKHFC